MFCDLSLTSYMFYFNFFDFVQYSLNPNCCQISSLLLLTNRYVLWCNNDSNVMQN
uniref:Uncharacterized protein n=1 Tax=Helianthus annuus TaxID=4232 RepID=A0A251UIH9_HELAN